MTSILSSPTAIPWRRVPITVPRGASWPSTRLFLGLLVLVVSLAPGAGFATTATARVRAIDGADIVLDAGQRDGLTVTAQVTLLREGEPIIHPLTGEVLGTPQEPVGTVQIYEAGPHSARGGLVKMYSEPVVGDLAEFQPQVEIPAPPPTVDVEAVKQRVEQLSRSVEIYRRRSEERLGTYPDFARRVLDEIGAMKSYLVSLDERMVALEEQQNENHFRLSSVLSGEYRQQDMKEFTIRYAADTQVRLRAAGKTLMIDIIADSLHMTPVEEESRGVRPPAGTDADTPGLLARLGFGAEETDATSTGDAPPAEDGDGPWYTSVYHLAAGIGLILALIIMVVLLIRRRYNDVMDGLEDIDDEYEGYLDDEEEEDEE